MPSQARKTRRRERVKKADIDRQKEDDSILGNTDTSLEVTRRNRSNQIHEFANEFIACSRRSITEIAFEPNLYYFYL
jgi:hypothetical protein